MLCSSFLRVKPTDGLVRYPNISRQLGLIPKPQKYINTSLLVEGDASYITILDQIQLPKYQIPSNAFLNSLATFPQNQAVLLYTSQASLELPRSRFQSCRSLGCNPILPIRNTPIVWSQICVNPLPSGKLTYLWRITIFNGKTHYKWPFSIAMLVYQRVYQAMVSGGVYCEWGKG